MVLPIEKGVTDIPPMGTITRSQTVQKLGSDRAHSDTTRIVIERFRGMSELLLLWSLQETYLAYSS